jgi:hypothetical protein
MKILIIFIYRVHTILLLHDTPQHSHSIFHYGVKTDKIHCFESARVPDVNTMFNVS